MKINELRLFRACESGDERQALAAISGGACDINAIDKDGNTALMFAIQSQNFALVKQMIANGADVNRSNSVGYCPLVVAVMGEMTAVVALLIENGAVVDESNVWIKKSIDFANNQGFYEIQNLLCGSNAADNNTIKESEAQEGLTDEEKDEVYLQFFDACTKNDYQAVEDILFVHSDWIDINKQINDGQTALWNCIDDGERARIVDLLLEKGADPNIMSNSGSTPFTLIFGDMFRVPNERIKQFVAHGADVNAKDGGGLTALMYFSARGDIDVVKYLLNKGANVYARSNIGYDAYTLAERDSHKKVMRLLKKAK